ncbi:hypothetical protein L9F63_012201, partial [Diploptera punctata]
LYKPINKIIHISKLLNFLQHNYSLIVDFTDTLHYITLHYTTQTCTQYLDQSLHYLTDGTRPYRLHQKTGTQTKALTLICSHILY